MKQISYGSPLTKQTQTIVLGKPNNKIMDSKYPPYKFVNNQHRIKQLKR